MLATALVLVAALLHAAWNTLIKFSAERLLVVACMDTVALLVVAMLGLALFNRLRIDDCEQRMGALKRSVMLEWLLGIGAVAAVSLLGTLPPMITT